MKSHIIVLGFEKRKTILKTIIAKVNASVLRVCDNTIESYQDSQTLLLSKDLYLNFANFLLNNRLFIQL